MPLHINLARLAPVNAPGCNEKLQNYLDWVVFKMSQRPALWYKYYKAKKNYKNSIFKIYLKNNSIKQHYTFLIDSADRDRDKYPNPNKYTIDFTVPFKNVIGMD